MMGSPKLLLLGIFGASAAALGGGLAFFPSGSEDKETSDISTKSVEPQEPQEPQEPTSPRRYKVASAGSGGLSGCSINWVENVYRDDSSMISFDELKQTFQSKGEFFNGAKLSDSEKQEFESSFLCEPNNQGSFYVGKDGESGDSTSGGEYSE